MNVSSIFSSAVSDISSVSSVSGVSQTSSTSSTASTDAAQGDSTSVSGPGQFLSKLKDLEKSDPAKAKKILTEIADKLKSAASNSTGQAAKGLDALADKFQTAADTGDLSSLTPPAQASSTHGSGHHGHRAYAKQQSQGDDQSSSVASIMSTAMSEMAE